jgi:hypothetical protein
MRRLAAFWLVLFAALAGARAQRASRGFIQNIASETPLNV